MEVNEETAVKRMSAKTDIKHPSNKQWQLRLYVAGQTPKCLTALANLKKLCEEHMAGEYVRPPIRWVPWPAPANAL